MRPEKQLFLDALKEKITQSQGMILVKYDHFSPNHSWDFCTRLKKTESRFEVVKKRIFLKAANECGLDFDLKDFQGHMGVVFVKGEALEATKTVVELGKERENSLAVLNGLYEGKIYSAQDMEAISKLPSRDEMRAQFLGLLEAPMSQTLAVVESLLSSVPYCLENKSAKE